MLQLSEIDYSNVGPSLEIFILQVLLLVFLLGLVTGIFQFQGAIFVADPEAGCQKKALFDHISTPRTANCHAAMPMQVTLIKSSSVKFLGQHHSWCYILKGILAPKIIVASKLSRKCIQIRKSIGQSV